jgi:hypothetical protein
VRWRGGGGGGGGGGESEFQFPFISFFLYLFSELLEYILLPCFELKIITVWACGYQ